MKRWIILCPARGRNLIAGTPDQSCEIGERLIEVVADIVDIFDAHRHPDVFGTHARRQLLLFGQLLVGGRSRVNHQRFGVPQIGQMAGELQAVDQLDARRFAAPNAEADNGARTAGNVFFAFAWCG